jgi:5-methylcytosine-specific restriction endonuclease McrA
MPRDARRTGAWRVVRAHVLAEESMCWLCKGVKFVNTPRHPLSRSVDHVVPLVEGGRPFDRRNLRLAHYGCNAARGARGRAPSSVDAPRSEDW